MRFDSELPTTHSIASHLSRKFTGPASAPIFQQAKYATTYSAEFGIRRLTTSPLLMPRVINRFAVRFTALSNSAYDHSRPSASEKRKGLSPYSATRDSSSCLTLSAIVVNISIRVTFL